jgi:hypothetical protein
MNHSALVVGFGKGHRSVVALKAKKPPGGAERGTMMAMMGSSIKLRLLMVINHINTTMTCITINNRITT